MTSRLHTTLRQSYSNVADAVLSTRCRGVVDCRYSETNMDVYSMITRLLKGIPLIAMRSLCGLLPRTLNYDWIYNRNDLPWGASGFISPYLSSDATLLVTMWDSLFNWKKNKNKNRSLSMNNEWFWKTRQCLPITQTWGDLQYCWLSCRATCIYDLYCSLAWIRPQSDWKRNLSPRRDCRLRETTGNRQDNARQRAELESLAKRATKYGSNMVVLGKKILYSSQNNSWILDLSLSQECWLSSGFKTCRALLPDEGWMLFPKLWMLQQRTQNKPT